MLFEMNEKGFSVNREYSQKKNNQNNDFEEYLSIINVFSNSSRKPIRTTFINSRSLAELLGQNVNSTKFNKKFFKGKVLSIHDKNNLILLRAIVEHNYEILLRMFNEAPNYMSKKLHLSQQSKRYFLLKWLIVCASLDNPYKQINQHTLQFLQNEDEATENQELLKSITGIDKDVFLCFCASASGDFSHYLLYLAKKNEKYIGLLSLFCWFHLPFISKIYQCKPIEKRKEVSVLLMYGLFECINEFFLMNGKNIWENEIGKRTLDYLKEKLQKARNFFIFFLEQIRSFTPKNPSWFTLDFHAIWNRINEDFIEEIFQINNQEKSIGDEEEKSEGKQENTENATIDEEVMNSFRNNFVEDYLKAIELFTSFMKKSEDNEKNQFFKFFSQLFYATSGLSRSEIISGLLAETENSKILDNFFEAYFANKEENPEKTQYYKGIIQIIMLGFEKIEKSKNKRLFEARDHLKGILENM